MGRLVRVCQAYRLMQGTNQEKWRELCAQAAVEQNPKKLLELTRQINELLSGKQSRVEQVDKPPQAATEPT
jgi:hypothetical protein